MSTKTLNRALEILEAHGKLDGSKDAVDAAAAAHTELAAIARAAKTVLRDKADEFVTTKDLDAAYGLMASIAKDVP